MRNLLKMNVLRCLLMLVGLASTWASASTLFVKGTATPYYKIDSGTYSQMTSSTTAGGVTWYYADVTSGTTVTFATNASGSNASKAIPFSSSSNSYFYYSSGTGVNLTYQKDYTYCNYMTAGSWWTNDNAVFNCHMHGITSWPGQAETAIAGGSSSTTIYVYTAQSTPTGLNFVRVSPSNRNTVWNQTSDITSVKSGRLYTITSANNDGNGVATSDTYVVTTWPTKPAATTYSFTVNVYDATGTPSVNGTALTATTSGTNCTWYTYTFSGTTLPSSVAIASNGGSTTATLTSPADGQTYYYAFNGYSIEAVSSDYDPNRRNLIYWPASSNYQSGKTQATLTTTDGINYSIAGVTLNEASFFIFATSMPDTWNNANFYTSNNGDQEFTGTTASGTAVHDGNNAYKLTNAGVWSFTYNIITNQWTATRTGDLAANTFTLHVIDYNGEQPYLYAWSGSDTKLNGDFPGAKMTETETSAAGETWYVQTFNSATATINAIVSLGGSSSQTSNITNIAPGDYYIVYNSTDHSYTASTTCPEGKVQKQKNAFTVYVHADAAPYIYAWNNNNQYIGYEWTGTQGEAVTLADGNTWYKMIYETYDNNINLLFHDGNGSQTGDITQSEPVAYYYYNGTTGYTKTTMAPTGEMYVIGKAGGNPWAANTGLKMTSTDNVTFTLKNVQIIAGAAFAFAAKLANTEDDWTTLQQYRFNSYASDGSWVVTSSMTNKDNPTPLGIQVWADADKTFRMDETAFYDITVDLSTMTATITRASDALYMYYGSHWAPNAGVPMFTTDGETYTLSNVKLGDEGTFQFTKQLGSNATTWPANQYRLGSNAEGDWWTITSGEIGIVLENALKAGSHKDFKMENGTAGTYRVVVNPTAGTLALYPMAQVLDGMTIIHLEKTSNVTDPVLWAYDKETLANGGGRIHEDRPARDVIYNTRVKLTPKVLDEVTTADGRKWWTWEVDNAIADFWFTREPYHYDGHNEANADMTDIQWRKAGELFLTWPSSGTALDEYTRDYYAAAAQEAADCAVMIEGHMYAYFTNTPGWDNVFCHAWNTDEQGNNHDLLTPPTSPDGLNTPRYPGALCELVGYDKDGYEVWRIDLTAAGVTTYPNGGILFNNGIDKPGDTKWDYFTGTETDADKEQTGDFAYSNGTCYDYCGVIVLGRSLNNIIRNGVVNGPVYTIEEDLVGVYFDENAQTTIQVEGQPVTFYGALYCKDLNNFVTTQYVEKSLQKEGQVDYMQTYYNDNRLPIKDRYDQSDWVKLTLSTQYEGYVAGDKEAQLALLRNYVGKVLPAETVQAQLVNNRNPEMRLAYDALPDAGSLASNDYKDNPNVFITCNFLGNQMGIDPYERQFDFFFVTPKPQEYATVTWAVYGGDDKFYVCTRECYDYTNGQRQYMNGFNLNGYFPVSWDMMDKPAAMESYTGQLFKFKGIIRLATQDEQATTPAAAPRRVVGINEFPWKTNVGTSAYMVSPIDLTLDESSIITAVRDLNTTADARQIAGVQYVNVAGQVSDRPFQGVNIVITRYTDGTTATTKVVR